MLKEKLIGFPFGTVSSETEELNHFYSDLFINEACLSSEFNEGQLQQIWRDTKSMVMEDMANPTGTDLRSFLVVDDGQAASRKDIIATIVNLGRHARMFLVTACQYLFQCAPQVRQNLDVIAIAADNNPKTIKLLQEEFSVAH